MPLAILKSVQLTSTDVNGQTSSVCEPSVANVGRQFLVTGNWFVSQSLDNGATWNFVDPYSFSPPAAGGFCCDQTVLHDPRQALSFRLLQYLLLNGSNVLRLAVKSGETLDVPDWQWWDFVPGEVDETWVNEWFDFNHAALSDNYFYIATNVYNTENNWKRCVVFRLPLSAFGEDEELTYDYFETTDTASLRCTQGATGTMYFAGHQTANLLRVYAWPETETAPTFTDVAVTPWRGGRGYRAPGPDARNWLSRCDPRLTGGWIADGIMGFLWSVDADASRPYPHVRVARISEQDMQRIDEPDIWSNDFAYAYPDAYPNVDGKIGLALFRGGNVRFPGPVVGVWDDAAGNWKLQAVANGTHGPSDTKWGDYVTCRRMAPEGSDWLAAGFSLQGGATRTFIRPQVIQFGWQ